MHIHSPLLSQKTVQAIGGKPTSLSRITHQIMSMLSGIQTTKHIFKTFLFNNETRHRQSYMHISAGGEIRTTNIIK